MLKRLVRRWSYVIFNHPQFSLPNTVASAASGFGAIGSTSVSPRIIQLALKYSF